MQAEADAQADAEQLAKETGPFKETFQLIRRREYIIRQLDTQAAPHETA